ncbi:hypothetical protein LPJ53_002811 [Coemansia erecta]|uniref:LITAF domain-containing protein n=1 Tax=Coemansia erecta TaxID=147472 RepID=A0A9W7Y1F9_9FUNG|nr:hypothetical protein LPJ53_002811 [Coemansia erecta]
MDEKQRLANNEHTTADTYNSGYNNPNPLPPGTLPSSDTTDLYDDPGVGSRNDTTSRQAQTPYGNAAQSPYTGAPQAPYQAPYGPYSQQQPTAGPSSGPSPYGPYGDTSNPPAYAPDAPPVSKTNSNSAERQTVVVDGVEGMQLPPDSYIEVTDVPANVKCPNCGKDIVTQIKTKTGTRTVVAAAAIFVVFWPLAFIPFMSKRLKKKIHVCPHCHHNLGKVISLTAVRPVDKH